MGDRILFPMSYITKYYKIRTKKVENRIRKQVKIKNRFHKVDKNYFIAGSIKFHLLKRYNICIINYYVNEKSVSVKREKLSAVSMT